MDRTTGSNGQERHVARHVILAACVCCVVFAWTLLGAIAPALAVSCVGCSLGNGQVIEQNPASGSIVFRFSNNVAATENGTFSHNQRCFYVVSPDGGQTPAFHVWSEYTQGGAPVDGGDELGSRRVLYLDFDSPLTPGCSYTIGCSGLWSFGSHDDSLASGDFSVTVRVADEAKDPGPGDGSGNGSGNGAGDGAGDGTGNGAGGGAGVGIGDVDGDGDDNLPSDSIGEGPGDSKQPADDTKDPSGESQPNGSSDSEGDETGISSNIVGVEERVQPLSTRAFEPPSANRDAQQLPAAVSQGRVYRISGQVGGGGGGGQGAPDEETAANTFFPSLVLLLAFLAFAIGVAHRQAWFRRQCAAPSPSAGKEDVGGGTRAA